MLGEDFSPTNTTFFWLEPTKTTTATTKGKVAASTAPRAETASSAAAEHRLSDVAKEALAMVVRNAGKRPAFVALPIIAAAAKEEEEEEEEICAAAAASASSAADEEMCPPTSQKRQRRMAAMMAPFGRFLRFLRRRRSATAEETEAFIAADRRPSELRSAATAAEEEEERFVASAPNSSCGCDDCGNFGSSSSRCGGGGEEDFVVINLNLFSPRWTQSYGADERWCMIRGNRPYYCPSGWTRFGVDVPGFEQAFGSWPVAYHGTAPDRVLSILQFGLLNPGEAAAAQQQQQQQAREEGRSRSRSSARNGSESDAKKSAHQQQQQHQHRLGMATASAPPASASAATTIGTTVTPSIEYAANDLQSSPLQLADGRWAQVVLQVRLRPGSFSVGPSTAWNWPRGLRFDDFFPNDELEWSVRSARDDVVISGVMIRVTDEHPRRALQRKREAVAAGTFPPRLPFMWQWHEGRGFSNFDPGMQVHIETVFQRGASEVLLHVSALHSMFRIDFREMKLSRCSCGNELWRTVRRVPRNQF